MSNNVYDSVDYIFNLGLHYFIPIIAVSVVCITLFFCKNTPVEEEYLAPPGLNQDEFTKICKEINKDEEEYNDHEDAKKKS